MSAPPPAPGVPPTPPPTAELPRPGEGFGAQPVTRARVSPVVTGLLGVAVGAGLALAIALPLTLGSGGAAAQADGAQQRPP